MFANGQLVITLLIVAVAAVYLGRCGWRLLRRKTNGGCGSSCGGCGDSKDVVELLDDFTSEQRAAKTPR